jgi:hypothetical protein
MEIQTLRALVIRKKKLVLLVMVHMKVKIKEFMVVPI